MKYLTIVLCLCLQVSMFSQEQIASEALLEEFQILKSAYLNLYPGLYRYQDEEAVLAHFDALEKTLQRDLSLQEAYLEYSKFLAKLQDGHVYANFWNQSNLIDSILFSKPDKIPFTFQLVNDRMIILKDGSEGEKLESGLEVIQINGVGVSSIIDSMLLVVKGDGSNRGQRMFEMQLSGFGKYEAFDIYFPMFFPPKDGIYTIDVRNFKTGNTQSIEVKSLTRTSRVKNIDARYGVQAKSNDDLWKFELLDAQTAYLKMGSFVTWKMDLDWKAFLKDAFAKIKAQNIENLIIDIRGNGGGTTAVYHKVISYLTKEKVSTSPVQALMRYDRVPDDLRPYLSTWSKAFYDRSGKVKDLGNGFYERKGDVEKVIRPASNSFSGEVFLLVDASNSSATFMMSEMIQRYKLATLVGQMTGGNKRGITGGEIFFLTLPHSGIEMDIPLIAGFPLEEVADEGIKPDVEVIRMVEDVVEGRDVELEVIMKLLNQ